MKLTRNSIMVGVAMLLLTTACSTSDRQAATTPTQSQSPSTNASVSPVANQTTIAWKDILGDTSLPPDWWVSPCSAVHLCVEFQGKPVGGIELGSFPVEQTELGALLSQSSNQSNSTKAQPSEPMLKALQSWVENHYTAIKRDRQTGLGKQAVFSSEKPEAVAIGQLQGLRYEFKTASKVDQKVFERSIGYVASDGKLLYVITTSVPESDAGGTFTNDAALRQFEPRLQQIVADLKLKHQN